MRRDFQLESEGIQKEEMKGWIQLESSSVRISLNSFVAQSKTGRAFATMNCFLPTPTSPTVLRMSATVKDEEN